MAEDRSRYYKLRLLDPDGNEIYKYSLRIYPEDENGDKWAKMQGAMLGQDLGVFALRHALTGSVSGRAED